MNILFDNCIICGAPIMVNAAESKDMYAFVCVACQCSEMPELDEEFETFTDWDADTIVTDLNEDKKSPQKKPLRQRGCECGADASFIPWHFEWCPLYHPVPELNQKTKK